MYKFLSIILASLLLLAGITLAYQKYDYNKNRKRLNNQLAKVQKMQKETSTAYSRLGIETKDLKSKSDKLNSIIKDRDEKVLALADTNINLRDRLIKISKARETMVSINGDKDASLTEVCKEEMSRLRYRVDFEEAKKDMLVTGFTLTNPGYAEIKIKWTKPLQLQLVLTKNDDGVFRVYVDSNNTVTVPTDLILKVDPSILAYKWYQKIGFGTDVAIGSTALQLNLKMFYDFSESLSVGPSITLQYNGKTSETFYGVSIGWHPWK